MRVRVKGSRANLDLLERLRVLCARLACLGPVLLPLLLEQEDDLGRVRVRIQVRVGVRVKGWG